VLVLGTPRIHVEECESTQLLLLDSSLPEGALATADHQTGGRGRLGRPWVETPGTSVLCSVLLRPGSERPVAQLSLVGGLAVARAVESAAGLAALIKWPNDVLVEGRKVAGVLAEQRGEAVVLGVGINVNQGEDQLPSQARVPAGSLRSLAGRPLEREEVLAALLGELDGLYARWRESGLVSLHGELEARDFLRGRRVSVGEVQGIAGGLDENGRLLVDGRPVESGEVSFAPDR
jgi:BirA family transcriptional regulator, biotin operon repressor / biotin---[acetyl-CoA-carboxylase] ligase